MKIVAFVPDLMDRSRLATALSGVEFAANTSDAADADVIVVDLARHPDAIGSVRESAPTARIVAFGPHVDDAALDRARSQGADLVIARSRFFRDPMAAVAPPD